MPEIVTPVELAVPALLCPFIVTATPMPAAAPIAKITSHFLRLLALDPAPVPELVILTAGSGNIAGFGAMAAESGVNACPLSLGKLSALLETGTGRVPPSA